MEKKYPVLKCNEELWNEIKPVLESFGITNFKWIYNFEEYPFLISNYGFCDNDELVIGNIDYNKIDMANSIRYLVNTKEEFLSAIAKLLGKEYPVKKENKQIVETKYPCIKCTQQLYNRIKDILKVVRYNLYVSPFTEIANLLVINVDGNFGDVSNINSDLINCYNRYECSNIREFLIKSCELTGFEVVYNIFVTDNDIENHYFKYVINNNVIEINETREDKGECSTTVTREKQWRKKFKKEDMVINCDTAVGESSTVVVTMPAKGNDFDKDKGSDLDIDKVMEKINIANKLIYCKKGTKLYSPIFGEVEYDCIKNNHINVIATTFLDEISNIPFELDGRFYASYSNAECLLFPSKDNRDWNNFQILEVGHRVMVSDDAINWSLRQYVTDNKVTIFHPNDDDEPLSWEYIVPVEEFDFNAEDITVNKEKSII